MNTKKYFNLINKYKYISFDIFDTLITRNLNKPTELFDLVQEEINRENIDINDFKNKRIEAEKMVSENINEREYTINDIYEEFYKIENVENKVENETIVKIKKIEINIEISMCEANYSFYNVYDYCKKNNKKIIITSDMYLTKEIIEKILKKNNYEYDKLYLSSDIGKRKSTGELYKYILNDLKIKPNEMIHFGDNYKSDYLRPKMLGINSKLVKYNDNKIKRNKKYDTFEYDILENYINNNIATIKNSYFYKLGFQVFGPLLYGYTKWLGKNLDTNPSIFFLSRDGQIMQKAYNMLYNKENQYMYASRRALIVPTLYFNSELEDIPNIMFLPRVIKIKNFIKKVGLDAKKYEKTVKENGYDLDEIVTIKEEIKNKNFINLYNELLPDIKENAKKEYESLQKYLNEIKFKGNIAIIDIGWNGNMQNALQNIINYSKINANIEGYYVGITPDSNKQKILKMHGYMFEKNKNEELFLQKKFFNSIFEIFFTADHGTLLNYVDGVNLDKFEYENTETYNNIQEIQAGALYFIKLFSKYNQNNYISYNELDAVQNFLEFGNNPSLYDIKMFKNFMFMDDELKNVIPKHGFCYYLFHPRIFKNDLRDSYWKTAFLKKVFKLNINYYKIVKKIREKLILNK